MIHEGGDPEAFVTFPRKIEAVTELVDWGMGRFHPMERHVFFVPDIGTLAVLSAKCDRLDLYRVELDELLKSATRDYLFVLSHPPASARNGEAYRYPLVVKSKQGGLTYKLAAAPPGMAIAPDGELTWTPATVGPADVSVAISDASGRETSQAFQIRVVGKE